MIKVYFETPNFSFAEEVAHFRDEETYYACVEGLEKLAKENNMIVTESLTEDSL